MVTMTQQQNEKGLIISDSKKVQQELGLVDPKSLTLDKKPDPVLEKLADDFIKKIMECNPDDPAQADLKLQNMAAVENLGAQTQKEASIRSGMLKEPIRKLAAKGEDGGDVANALVDLNMKVEDLDPAGFNFEPGWFARTLGFIPGFGKPLKRYFIKFESSQTILDAIFRSLEQGAEMLQRDNLTLSEDQKNMRMLTLRLQQTIQLGMLLDKKLSNLVEREVLGEDPRRKFVQDEILFPVRQRIMDLQQQLAVNQQGVLSIEIIIRNNKELIRGVNRAINVTINALNVAVIVALALANQKIVLDKINMINKTTDKLIGDTARKLKTQGAAIHKDAATSKLDINTLKQAFSDIKAAMDDISKFRQEALPQMANTILEMDKLTLSAEDAIRKMEQGNHVAPMVTLDVGEFGSM
ncbi:MAG: toxic anion resistance protein [Deltaproteobacteria bacterium]|nr:toxic anion resistance protein [Deltaproteobacteria bacterium]